MSQFRRPIAFWVSILSVTIALAALLISMTVQSVTEDVTGSSTISGSPDGAPFSEFLGAPSVAGGPTYSRARFGSGWADFDRNGCDTREEVLARDGRDNFGESVMFGSDGCVIEVTIIDPYTGERVVGKSEIDIDHRVALSWAWAHGADAWTDQRRRQFANDEINLIATSDNVNRSKSDKGPAEWLPWDPARCQYAADWRRTLDVYDLRIGAADDEALVQAQGTC